MKERNINLPPLNHHQPTFFTKSHTRSLTLTGRDVNNAPDFDPRHYAQFILIFRKTLLSFYFINNKFLAKHIQIFLT